MFFPGESGLPEMTEGQVYQALREVDNGPWQNVRIRLGKPIGLHAALGEFPWVAEENSPWNPSHRREGFITRYGIHSGEWMLVT